MAHSNKSEVTYPTVDIIAAAIIAFRKNNNTIEKCDSTDEISGIKIVSNKSYAVILLQNPELITQDDRNEAIAVIQHIQGQVTMSLLSDKTVSIFNIEIAKALEEKNNPERKIGLLLYAPNSYYSAKIREKITEQTQELCYTSKALGNVGDKIVVNFTKIEHRYVSQCNFFSAYGKDDNGNLISFLTQKEELCESQKLVGKIKNVGPDKYRNGATVTQLNFVKVVK